METVTIQKYSVACEQVREETCIYSRKTVIAKVDSPDMPQNKPEEMGESC